MVLSQEETCSLEGVVFSRGDSLGDTFVTRCGSAAEFPCYCNPDLVPPVECPYCGFATGSGELFCAKDNETIDFQDSDLIRSCFCQISSEDPTQPPIRTCQSTALPGTPPERADICSAQDSEGSTISVLNGESFGNLIEGACGSASDWPSFCNTDEISAIGMSRQSDNENVEYPYCIFENTFSGDTVCARDNQEIDFRDDNGVDLTCTCLVASPALGGAESSCKSITVKTSPPDAAGTPRPTPQPTTAAPVDSSTTVAPTRSDDGSSAPSHKQGSLMVDAAVVASSTYFLLHGLL